MTNKSHTPEPKKKIELTGVAKLKESQSIPPVVFAIEISNPLTKRVVCVDSSAFTPNLKLYLDSTKSYSTNTTYIGSPEEGKVFSLKIGDILFKNTRV